jgi:hypothetical protein
MELHKLSIFMKIYVLWLAMWIVGFAEVLISYDFDLGWTY